MTPVPIRETTSIRTKKAGSWPRTRYVSTNRPKVPGSPKTASGAPKTKKLLAKAQSPSCSSLKKPQKPTFLAKPIPRCNTFAISINDRPAAIESDAICIELELWFTCAEHGVGEHCVIDEVAVVPLIFEISDSR